MSNRASMTAKVSARPRRRPRSARAVAGVAILLGVCGSDDIGTSSAATSVTADLSSTPDQSTSDTALDTVDSASQDCVAAADAFMQDYDQLPTALPDEFTPLSAAPASGKRAIYLPGPTPTEPIIAREFEAAAESVGWTGDSIAYDGSVEDFNSKFAQAIAQDPDVIVVFGQPLAAMSQSVAAAKEAGIVVVAGSEGGETGPAETTGYAATIQPVETFREYGEIQANWVMRDSECMGKVAVFGLPIPVIQANGQSLVDTIEANCADCEATYTDFQFTDLGTPAVATRVVSTVQADPDIKYLAFPVGTVAIGVVEALDAAGISGVRILGASPDDANLKALQDGTNSMFIANTSEIAGWALLDAALRVLDTGEPWDGHAYPIAVVTSENVDQSATQVGEITYPTTFREDFKALWNVD